MAASAESARVSVRSTVASLLHQVAAEHGRTLAPLTDELKLFESGLDSLSVAIVVMRLAELLGSDPFDNGSVVKHPITFGDFVRMYETAQPGHAREPRLEAAR
jgi:phenylalanyl-tRNA synthetase beta subunit